MGGKSRKLFDFSYLLLPAVLKVLYVLCTIAIFATGVFLIVKLWSDVALETRVLYIAGVALSPFLVRFVFEILLLPFRISEDLRAIRLRYEQPPRMIEPEQRRNRAPETASIPAPNLAPTPTQTAAFVPSPQAPPQSPQPPQPLQTVQMVQTPQIQPMPAPKPADVQSMSLEVDRVAQALRTNDPFRAPPVHRTDREQ